MICENAYYKDGEKKLSCKSQKTKRGYSVW